MPDTPPKVGDNSEPVKQRFAKDHLKAFVERIERLEEEKAAIASDVRDVYGEAKANGFDVKALRAVVRLRAQEDEARKAHGHIVDTYCNALGIEW